ncbi:unnamed protein product, partial [Mesorhabditis spiculigera]
MLSKFKKMSDAKRQLDNDLHDQQLHERCQHGCRDECDHDRRPEPEHLKNEPNPNDMEFEGGITKEDQEEAFKGLTSRNAMVADHP